MARLELERAPAPTLPRRFLLTAPWWGMAAGGLLLVDGGLALTSRWSSSTLALVHAFTLGVLGNAMFGSLLQFLPAAAGVRVQGGHRAARGLHGLLNIGTALLVLGLRCWLPSLLAVASAALFGAFALLAWMVLPGLACAAGQRLLRTGVGIALIAALVTVALGIGILYGMMGSSGLQRLTWVDMHAGWGVLGWVLGLIGSIAGVTMPMFQGTAKPSAWFQLGWLLALILVLVVSSLQRIGLGFGDLLRWGGVGCVAVWTLALLRLQLNAPRQRNRSLTGFWRAGLLALFSAALVLAGDGEGMLAGTLAIAVGLPLLVAGMQLEIVAFLGWIQLHHRCGRGVRIPSVHALLPAAEKERVLVWLLVAATALLAAVQWPGMLLARVAGTLLLGGYLVLWLSLRGVDRRQRKFLARLAHSPQGVVR